MVPSDVRFPPACIDLHLHSQYSDGEGTIPQVVKTAVARGFTTIALTDHTDVEGNFKYSIYGKRNFATYLYDIQEAREKYPGINILCGIEITESFGPIPDRVESIYRACDLILIDGYYVRDPIRTAQRIRDWCEISHIFTKNIGISHPKFDELTPLEINIIARSEIFLELNNSKLNKAQITGIELYLTHPASRTTLWSIGSDAHSLPLVGDVSIAWGILQRFQLYKNLIVPVAECKNLSPSKN